MTSPEEFRPPVIRPPEYDPMVEFGLIVLIGLICVFAVIGVLFLIGSLFQTVLGW